ncbi:MAG: hypothetical protein MUC29_09360 [Pyrinomonadaceae bacterium]|nr:hypothetical protein [Pyrinomonadaceae bacterium]
MFCKSIFLILFIFTNLVSAQQTVEKKQLPPIKEPRSRTIDVNHIKLDLRFDWQKKQAFGTSEITFSPLNPTDKISLDAGFLTINSIKSSEKSLKFDYAGGDKNDNLKITLDRIYQVNEQVTVRIDYHTNYVNEIDPNTLGGNFGKGLRFNQPTSDDPIKIREIWSMGEPESNRYWFPSFDAPNDWRTTEFIATVDKKLTVISNGNLIKTTDNADSTRTFHFKTETPYANHLTSFAVGEYVNVKKKLNEIELNNFGYEREKMWIDASTERLPDMVSYFSKKIRVRFPQKSYSQVFVQDIASLSYSSNFGLSTITENMIDDYQTHADFLYLWDLVEAEALAGQWFHPISPNDWSDVWLNKSLARHLNCLYTDHKNGRAEWLLWVHGFDQGTYFNDWNSGIRRPIVTKNYEDAATMTSDNYSTIRGGLVLNMVRKQIGDENWWKSLRIYLTKNAGKPATTKDFQNAVEEASGEKLDWFFDQWIYKMGHPIFEVSKSFDDGKLTLKVKQTQQFDQNNPYPQSEFFQGKIEIEIDGRIETVWLKPQAENIFTFNLSNSPKFVNFDYENTWIRELKYEQDFAELFAQFQKTKDALARQSAMFQISQIAKDAKTLADDKASIFNALRDLVLSKTYWRVRLGALSQLVGLNPNDEKTISTLLTVIKNDKSWLRANAIGFLGNTKDKKYTEIYLKALDDESFRVINSAAVALGKTKDVRAFDALFKLKDKPSMKSQSLISALLGLKELGDPRGFDIAYKALSNVSLPRWRLPLPAIWDYRVFAADTINSLGKSVVAFPLIFDRFKKSMAENDLNGMFYNLNLMVVLGDKRGQEAFDLLKVKFKDDTNLMNTINQYETQFKENILQK